MTEGPPQPPRAANDSAAELQATLTKYKRLLSLARRSIEEKQGHLKEKEGLVAKLQAALAEARGSRGAAATEEDIVPRELLRQVKHGNSWWVLAECNDEAGTQAWKGFKSEQEMIDFTRRRAGEPLKLPPPSLSVEESEKKIGEAREHIARIREDFRRYRVKSELHRKQKDAEVRLVAAGSIAEKQRHINGDAGEAEDRQRQQTELSDQVEMWKAAYEKQVRETEQLKRVGSEVAMATQWRHRYEQCQQEKEELLAKFEMSKGASAASEGYADLMTKYADLKEEYKLYRRKARAALQIHGGGDEEGSLDSEQMHMAGSELAKLQYLKNLMLQYLGTHEITARTSMERAIATVLGFSDEEQKVLADKREQEKWGISGLSGILGH
ncbi:unnamed protein product [Chrysoparadoxa australica]